MAGLERSYHIADEQNNGHLSSLRNSLPPRQEGVRTKGRSHPPKESSARVVCPAGYRTDPFGFAGCGCPVRSSEAQQNCGPSASGHSLAVDYADLVVYRSWALCCSSLSSFHTCRTLDAGKTSPSLMFPATLFTTLYIDRLDLVACAGPHV